MNFHLIYKQRLYVTFKYYRLILCGQKRCDIYIVTISFPKILFSAMESATTESDRLKKKKEKLCIHTQGNLACHGRTPAVGSKYWVPDAVLHASISETRINSESWPKSPLLTADQLT